jgi:hypothetical protein
MVLLPPVSLRPLIPSARMRVMRCAAAAMNRDSTVAEGRRRRCAFDYRVSPLLSAAATCRRSSGVPALNGHLTEIVRALLCLHLPAALPGWA